MPQPHTSRLTDCHLIPNPCQMFSVRWTEGAEHGTFEETLGVAYSLQDAAAH